MSSAQVTLPLPDNFRVPDQLHFHQRDPQALAERVTPDSIEKGICWAGQAACLRIRFLPGEAEASLAVDGAGASQTALARLVQQILGLNQAVDAFEAGYNRHPVLGPLIARHPGLRVSQTATPFEALTWAITGQQLSIEAAVSLRRKLIQTAGLVHSGGLACYPDAARVAALEEVDLHQAGFSRSKTQTLLTVSRQVQDGTLPLDAWLQIPPPEDEIRLALLALKGIGPWTVNYTLLRGFGWLDGSLHGDAGVRLGLQRLLQRPEKLAEEETRAWLAPFSPWRALVAAHLWTL